MPRTSAPLLRRLTSPRGLAVACTLAAGGLAACTQGHRVYHVSVAPEEAHGIHYALPRTALEVDLEVTTEQEVRGACFDAIELRVELGLAPVSALPPPSRRSNSSSSKSSATATAAADPTPPPESAPLRRWTTLKATLRERIEVDPEEIYLVDLRSRGLETLEGVFELSPEGLLGSATLKAEHRGLDIAVAATGAAVDIASLAFGATFAGDTSEVSCQVYANRIKALRGQRQAIFAGTWQGLVGGIPRDTLDRVLTGIDRQEEALVALFSTSKTPRQDTVRCAVTPRRNDTAHASGDLRLVYPLITIDRRDGGISAADPGVPCMIPDHLRAPATTNSLDPSATTTAYLTLDLRPDGLANRADPSRGCQETAEGRCTGPQGLFYRIPREARATVWWAPKATEILSQRPLMVPQLGITAALPREARRVRSQQTITLHPETGALRTVSSESQTISREQVEALADDAVRLHRNINAARNRDPELEALRREREALEEAVRIQEAREKLGGDPPGPATPGGGGSGGSQDPRPEGPGLLLAPGGRNP